MKNKNLRHPKHHQLQHKLYHSIHLDKWSFHQCQRYHLLKKGKFECFHLCWWNIFVKNLLYSPSCGVPSKKEQVKDSVVVPLIISTSNCGLLRISPKSGLSAVGLISGSSSVSTVWLTLKLITILQNERKFKMN